MTRTESAYNRAARSDDPMESWRESYEDIERELDRTRDQRDEWRDLAVRAITHLLAASKVSIEGVEDVSDEYNAAMEREVAK